ncbi:hypothetical protein ACFL2B_02310 [Patescibacteria group bacterium]
MPQDQRQQLVDYVFNYFVEEFKREFAGQLSALYIVGSYSIGRMSLEKPDLNFLLILDGIDPEDHILLGEVFKEAMLKMKGTVGIRPYFPPVRFIYPENRENYDVFVSTVMLDSRKQDLALPFGITRFVLDGYISSRKLLAGDDILGKIELPPIAVKSILERSLVDLEFFRLPLEKAPVQYRSDELDLLLSESIVLGKAVVYLGVEVAMNDEQIANKEYMKFFEDPSLFHAFYKEKYGPEVASHAKLILQARDHYLSFKESKAKTLAVYESALKLIDAVEDKIFDISLA